ncbi:hypothetical protein XBI1_1170002 [Xenorhabdus bovienii str. Intermedium]|uniref:Uncharacterized protein n=1 Tax=Xenorhabdus bovienii str. Intermedium TaxID=1379677 RepID=A0A077QF94_XENBV|nr:hypothetical protein XBI1_1170002 [Xenorhabdus bovienii str. Intermedium]
MFNANFSKLWQAENVFNAIEVVTELGILYAFLFVHNRVHYRFYSDKFIFNSLFLLLIYIIGLVISKMAASIGK